MPLTVYNTLTRQKETFVPLNPENVRMYVCGMTVYDYCHLGHARVMMVFDMIARWLRQSGYPLTYVRNITDIDDKIIARAAENGETIGELTTRFIAAMHEDADALGVIRPDVEPKATEHVAQMIAMIERLIANGKAYAAENGDVYYAVREFPAYGQLSGKSLDDLRAGERVEVDSFKRDPLDFVLWKAAKPNEADFWPSPWGNGRPGWHIECSAMAEAHLGPTIDIHAGGIDLQFPHHENEVAQSECAHGGQVFARWWLHNGMLNFGGAKMSKSVGNIERIHDLVRALAPPYPGAFVSIGAQRVFIGRTRHAPAPPAAPGERLRLCSDGAALWLLAADGGALRVLAARCEGESAALDVLPDIVAVSGDLPDTGPGDLGDRTQRVARDASRSEISDDVLVRELRSLAQQALLAEERRLAARTLAL